MDLKQYFRKIRQVEAGLIETFPLVVSLETPDGGKPVWSRKFLVKKRQN